jgi:hypothetical protein
MEVRIWGGMRLLTNASCESREVESQIADATVAETGLRWTVPSLTRWLVATMVRAEITNFENQLSGDNIRQPEAAPWLASSVP